MGNNTVGLHEGTGSQDVLDKHEGNKEKAKELVVCQN
jgi:hypothetical protein